MSATRKSRLDQTYSLIAFDTIIYPGANCKPRATWLYYTLVEVESNSYQSKVLLPAAR